MILKDNMIRIRRMSDPEIPSALDLALKVFSEYESPDYSTEGTEEFRKCLHDEEYLYGIDYYGAFDSSKLIGLIGIRSNLEHICFFFVDGKYHRKGIGTKMFDHLLENYKGNIITVNSSPFGVDFYKKLGFDPTEEEKTINGIRFTPMIYRRKVIMEDYIAYCGLDCETCEAHIATVNNDNNLRAKVAKEWSELNKVEITPEMINCAGCRIDGVKTPFCDSLCPIRQCALGKAVETCGDCSEMSTCEKLVMITGNNEEALKRLKR
jgi:GNAT superfamily N-acetyltransferase